VTEQARARQYRLDAQAREDNRLARERALSGSASAKAATLAAWEPLRRWEGWDPDVHVTEKEDE